MAKTRSKLNDKSEEYIEQNILKDSPEGLPPCASVPEEGEIVFAHFIPEMRRVQFINKEYDLPVEIIEHLENCAEKQYGYRTGPSGHPEMYTKSLKYIFRCQPIRKTA